MVKFQDVCIVKFATGHRLIVTTISLIISLLVGCGALVSAYSQTALEDGARFLWILGIIWLIAFWRRWRWFAAVGLLIFIALAAYGLWISLPPGLMILGALGGLLSWDLQELTRRLHYALRTEDVRALEKRHIGRLLIVAGFGLLLAIIATFVHMRLTREHVVILGLVSAVGLIQLARWLESRGE